MKTPKIGIAQRAVYAKIRNTRDEDVVGFSDVENELIDRARFLDEKRRSTVDKNPYRDFVITNVKTGRHPKQTDPVYAVSVVENRITTPSRDVVVRDESTSYVTSPVMRQLEDMNQNRSQDALMTFRAPVYAGKDGLKKINWRDIESMPQELVTGKNEPTPRNLQHAVDADRYIEAASREFIAAQRLSRVAEQTSLDI